MTETRTGEAAQVGLVSNAASLLASGVAGNVGFFAAALLLARWLGPSGRGSVAFATLSILTLAKLARLGLSEAASVFAASDPESRPVLLVNQLAFALVVPSLLGAAFVGVLELAGARPASITSTTLVLVAIGGVLETCFETLASYLVSCGRVRVASWTGVVQPWGWTLGVVAARSTGTLTPAIGVLAWIAPLPLAITARLVSALREDGIGRPDLPALEAAVRFGLPAWLGGASTFLNARFDQVLMGFISSRRQLGFYAVAVNMSEVLLYLGTATGIALTPAIAQGDPDEAAERALRVLRAVVLVTFVGTIASIALGPLLIPFMFGHAYEASRVPFLVLALGACGWTASSILSAALLGAHAPALASRGAFVAAAITIALDVVLIPRFAANGAAIANTCGFFAASGAAGLAFTRRFGVPFRALVPGREDARAVVAFASGRLSRRR